MTTRSRLGPAQHAGAPLASPRRAAAACVLALLTGCGAQPMTVDLPTPFGQVDGRTAQLYTLRNANGLVARVTNYGGILVSMEVPDRDGQLADVVLGYDDLAGYVADDAYFGATVGRVGNRIGGASFELDGVTYELAANNAPHHLHGGPGGFSKQVWEGEQSVSADGQSVALVLRSADGHEGYPGDLVASVTYTLTDDDVLRVEHMATARAPTPVNLVHHSYWNLGGHGSGPILDHRLQVNAARYTPGDETLLPTGEVADVAGTPYDFREPMAIGARLAEIPGDPGGYDVNFALDGGVEPGWREAAVLHDPASGRVLTIQTDAPGLQLYSGNFLDGRAGKGGARYPRNGAVCLETQVWPDAIHHQGEAGWPDVVLRPGETYRHVIEHHFGVR